MNTTCTHDLEWQAIVALTHAIAARIDTEDNDSLLAQLNQRNEKIRDYFHGIEEHSERLHDIKQRIAALLSLDEHIMGNCRALQTRALQQLGAARRAEQGVKAYSANQSAADRS